MSISVAVIGECMVELSHAAHTTAGRARPMAMSYGGDTINTSIYLSRHDVSVSYITGLGDDVLSDWLLEEWSKEGIDCSLVARLPNSVPGMYMINVDDQGERSFLYWRKGSPASRLFDDPDKAQSLFAAIAHHEYLYLSGISLAILDHAACERLFGLLTQYRKGGGKIIFDGNYRPNLWASVSAAQQAYSRMYQITDIALPTLEDEAMLFGFTTAEHVLQAIKGHGVPEIVVKMGGDGCLVLHDDTVDTVAAQIVDAVDTTAAGDSFNAGYLAARLTGASGIEACHEGHKLASCVIQHRGAIIPK